MAIQSRGNRWETCALQGTSTRGVLHLPERLFGLVWKAEQEVEMATVPHNKGLQLTKAARCAPFAFRLWGQSLKAAFAAEARCSTGTRRAEV